MLITRDTDSVVNKVASVPVLREPTLQGGHENNQRNIDLGAVKSLMKEKYPVP